MKLCEQCTHFQGESAASECKAPENGELQPNYVHGGDTVKYRIVTAQWLRMNETLCGKDAKWFEEKK